MAFFACSNPKKESEGFVLTRIENSDTIVLDADATDSPVLDVNISLYEVTLPDIEATGNITNAIANAILEKDAADITTVCNEYINCAKAEYFENKPDYTAQKEKGEEYFWFNHTKEISSEVESGYKKYISYVLYFYEFEGGAHPSSWTKVLNFDATDGKEIVLDDIMKEGYTDILIPLIEAGIARYFEVETMADVIENAFLFQEDIYVPQNFILSKDKITFIYNRYEIAPYAAGEITVEIPYTDIEEILR